MPVLITLNQNTAGKILIPINASTIAPQMDMVTLAGKKLE